MSSRRSGRGFISRGSFDPTRGGAIPKRGRGGARNETNQQFRGGGGRGRRGTGGGGGGRSSSTSVQRYGTRNGSRKWCILVMNSSETDEELKDFQLGLTYKLQQKSANFALNSSKLMTFRETNADNAELKIFRESRDGPGFEFCLVIIGANQNRLEVEDQLSKTQVPLIFVEDFSSDGISKTADKIIKIKSNGVEYFDEEFRPQQNRQEETHPMSERKIHELAENESMTDEEILLKLTSDGTFLRRLDCPTNRLDSSDVLKLITRACRCNASHYRRSLNELLESLCSSKFWTSTLLNNVVKLTMYGGVEIQRNQFGIKNLLVAVTSIVVEILRSVESRAQDVFAMKTILSTVLAAPAIHNNTTIYNDELRRNEESLQTLWRDVVESKATTIVADSKIFDVRRNAENQPPPNNFRELSIFPTQEDILTDQRPFLRENVVSGAYDSVEHYLDVQFRLLREDYIDPLRKGINVYLNMNETTMDKKRRLEIKIYDKVKIMPPQQNKKSALLTYRVQFDVKRLKHVRWEISRRFLYGSLLCLSSDNFKTLAFATVYDRKVEDLKKGELDVVFELIPPDVGIVYRAEYRMAESSAYFEAYRHVLLALLAIRDERDMPFPKYFIRCDPHIDSPLFLRAVNADFDLTCLLLKDERKRLLGRGDRRFLCNILRSTAWPTKENLGLDESQYKALKLALTKELAVIQGPPGTGKTFIGYKIAQALLENHNQWQNVDDKTPILVVCYTNHALDQFLEGLSTFMSDGIIRIGGRSKNEAMQKYLLRNVSNTYELPGDLRYRLRQEHAKKICIENRIAQLSKLVQNLDKAPLNHAALEEVVENRRLLAQILDNPKRLTISKDILLNIWLTNETQVKKQGPLLDLANLRELMYYTQMPQSVCMNVLYLAKNDFDRAYVLLLRHPTDPRLYNVIPELKNIPPIESVDTIMQQFQFNEEDAVFALQQNRHDLNLAVQWLTAGYQNVQEETFDERKAVQAAAADDAVEDDDEQIDVEELDDENRILDDDDDEALLRNVMNDYWSDDFQINAVQDWTIVNKNNSNQFPQCVWNMIVKSRPFTDDEYRRVTDERRPVDVWKLSMRNRWRLYKTWLEKFRTTKDDEIRRYQRLYFNVTQQMREIRSLEQSHVFRQAKILGMTTTGAAKYQAVLNAVKPKIVIVEEAAEVLESHIVTSLSAACQQVILIGDHKQLRPSPAVYDLAKRYHFDVSLFERLINNKFDHVVLEQQHRMRPDIADSLMPYFYENLKNNEQVYAYESVKGIAKNLYFFHHTNPEKQEGDSTSRQNEFEGKMIVGFAKYLLQQGYKASQITILCCYAGQMFFIKKFMKSAMLPEQTVGLRVTVVDNYQGEECEIILLSLVRSNNEKLIGFLKVENRVCVALSRAKWGLYCFGNFEHLAHCSPELWGEMVENLKSKSCHGQMLPLICQIHKKESTIKTFEDFQKMVPEGGCKELCLYKMDCGHACRKYCHPDDADHKKVRCVSQCERTCPAGHPCKKKCFESCGDCKTLVEKTLPACGHKKQDCCYKSPKEIKCQVSCEFMLPCGHKCQETCDPLIHTKNCKKTVEKLLPCGHREKVECYKRPDEIRCTSKVRKTWPFCGHVVETNCFVDVRKEECKTPCGALLDCEHSCKGTCSSCRYGRLHVQCDETCTKVLVCGHECGQKCTISCPPCEKACEMLCVHSRCTISKSYSKKGKNKNQGRSCGLPCPGCVEPCGWTCEHFEPCKKKCSEQCDRPRCDEKCKKVLNCGHPCLGLCGEPCPSVCAVCPTQKDKYKELTEIFFGYENEPDARFVELPECKHIFESVGFDSYVDCSVREVKLLDCPKCRKPILTCRRYGNVSKSKFADVQSVKRRIQGDVQNFPEEKDELLRKFNVGLESDLPQPESVKVYDAIIQYLENHTIRELTRDKLDRLTSMADFLERLTKLEVTIEKYFVVRKLPSVVVESPILLDFLKRWASNCFNDVTNNFMTSELVASLRKEHSKLLFWIWTCYRKASIQMMNEFSCELSRFKMLIEVYNLLKCLIERNDANVMGLEDLDGVMKILHGSAKITEELEKKCAANLKTISLKLNLRFNISEEERKQIMAAMNMRQGHWFKCRNGHIYCITECGGATQESICPECRAPIGGTGHRLRPDNAVATEMDGATMSDWDMEVQRNNLPLAQIGDLLNRFNLR